MSIYSDLKGGSAGSATTVYSTIGDLPLSDVTTGAQAYVSSTNRLYIWNGTGWYNIALINTAPTITTGGSSSYDLAIDGTATVITLAATDPEEVPITWSYAVTAGSLGSTATVSQANNVFTITPSTVEANAGEFTLTFTASDGVNLATSASEFSLVFSVANSRYTSLLAQAVSTGTNSTFADASAEAHTVTNTGVSAGTFSPYRAQGYSAYFGNNDDGITISASSQLGIQGSDFCIEAWVKPTSKIDSYPRILHGGTANWSTNDSWALLCGHNDADHGSGTKYSFAAVAISGNSAVLTSTTSIDFGGDWQHVCVTRNGTTLSLYINGIREDTATTSNNLNSSATNALSIGRNGDTNSSYHGYMRDIRIIKGSAFRDLAASGSFDLPTEPLTNVSGTGYATALLACQGNNFKDYGDGNLSLAVQAGVSMQPITPYDRQEYSEAVDGSSGYFNGSSKLTLPSAASLQFGTGAFTIECWFNTTVSQQYTSLVSNETNSTGFTILLNPSTNSGSIVIYNGSAGLILSSLAGGYNDGAWHHIAYTRDGNSARLYLDGVIQQTNTGQATFAMDTGGTWNIGDSASFSPRDYTGYISDFRVVKGTAVYTSAFTPPTAPVTAVANTTFLMNPNPSIIDKAQNYPIHLVGDASGSNTQQLFSTSTLYLDGNDYAIVDRGAGILGAGDFTVEAWYKNDSSSGNYRTIIEKGIVGGTPQNGAWSLGTRTGSDVLWFAYYNSGFNDLIATSVNPNDGSWHHLAVARSGSTFKMFFDGVQVHSSTLTASLGDFTNQNVNIGYNVRNGSYIKGYLQDVRVTKGLARYTATFTPPTALLKG